MVIPFTNRTGRINNYLSKAPSKYLKSNNYILTINIFEYGVIDVILAFSFM